VETKKYLSSYQSKFLLINKTLVLDLDETLVHSSFVFMAGAQIKIPINVDGYECNVYVAVRPGAQYFLEEVSKNYEVIIYTASISKYAEPLMNTLDSRNL
jgi:RNA polymerase II subunit A small phosphatase-like protein